MQAEKQVEIVSSDSESESEMEEEFEEVETPWAKQFNEEILNDAFDHEWGIVVERGTDFGHLRPPKNFACRNQPSAVATVTYFGMTFDIPQHILNENIRRTGQDNTTEDSAAE